MNRDHLEIKRSTVRDRLRRLNRGLPGTKEGNSVESPGATMDDLDEGETAGGSAVTAGKQRTLDRLRRLMNSSAAVKEAPKLFPSGTLEELVPGNDYQTPFGACYCSEQTVSPYSSHGSVILYDLLHQPVRGFELVTGEAEIGLLDFNRTVFFDTETTGLAGGTGTYIFMTGIGYFEKDQFIIRQFFMRDYAEEKAMLWATSELIKRRTGLVTYNGRAYDVPLLETRFLTNRMTEFYVPGLHLDMLPVCRKLWRLKHGSCKLTDLERRILEIGREHDIPGELIPSVYFRYLKTGDAGRVKNIFIHNRYDLLTLAALTLKSLHLINEPERHASVEEYFSLGRICQDRGALKLAERYFLIAQERAEEPRLLRETAARLWLIARRNLNYGYGKEILERMSMYSGWAGVYALQELAKVFEHYEGDHSAALAKTEQALERSGTVETVDVPSFIDFPDRQSLEHRKRRLLEKIRKLDASSQHGTGWNESEVE